ncbi:hypothetical protein IIB79_09990 [candidate division KSB1 bacterium]|nr:hypothetical protein [candidate division KSB1 bacterium]
MKSFKMFVIILLNFILIVFSAGAQEKTGIEGSIRIPDSTNVQILKTIDGATNIGRIVAIGEDSIQFATGFGTITVLLSMIEEIMEVPASSIRNGKYWFPNPNATRLFFAPTGRMLKQGEGYFSDYYIFFPGIAVGITDNITLGGGMSLFPWAGADQFFYFTPKIGLKTSENSNFAAGALIIKLPDFGDDNDSPTVGILYGVGTWGTPEGSFTAGFGYGFVGGDLAEKPMIMLGGEKRLSRRTAFVTENWILPGVEQPLVSFGIRFFGEGLSVDLALINTIGEDTFFPGIPWLDFVFNF